jgi:hypothetical protein
MTDADPKVKRPASQYYWGDWWKDKALHSCSQPARGLWHEMNCLMHEGEPYGHLTLNGKPMQPAQLANLCRITTGRCKAMLEELEGAGVFSRVESGAIFSRRMVRDEDLRNRRAAGGQGGAEHGIQGAGAGSKGGRPKKLKGGSETPLAVQAEGGSETPHGSLSKPPPSSSSSSSSSASAHTSAGEACKAMRKAGMAEVNPSHPELLALLAGGITVDELAEAAESAVTQGKGFVYAMRTAAGRRKDAAKVVQLPAQQREAKPWDGAR